MQLINFQHTLIKGDKIAIVGPNGSGKSTLVNMIAKAIKVNEGKIIYNFEHGQPNENIGIQFQENIYPANINVKDIIAFYRTIHRHKITKKYFEHILEEFQIYEIYKKRINDLSGGQKQRLNILIAIMHRPQLMILDEISTGLDISIQEKIAEFIKALVAKNNLTLLIVSHNVFEINTLCDRL